MLSATEFEKALNNETQRRLATDAAYLNAKNATARHNREKVVVKEAERHLRSIYDIED